MSLMNITMISNNFRTHSRDTDTLKISDRFTLDTRLSLPTELLVPKRSARWSDVSVHVAPSVDCFRYYSILKIATSVCKRTQIRDHTRVYYLILTSNFDSSDLNDAIILSIHQV